MRALVPLLTLLSLAAACGGGSNPRSTATPSSSATATRLPTATPAPTTQAVIPFTPVEEVLTPPPDIDTSGWLTYRDDANGFELKYPRGAQVKRDISRAGLGATGVGTEISLPFESGTTLEEKYIFIKVTDTSQDTCMPLEVAYTPPPRAATPDVGSVRAEGAVFWRTHSLQAMAFQGWYQTIYMTARGTSCVTLDAVLAGMSSGAPVDTPPRSANDEKESETFTAIISSFRWTNP